MKAIVCVDENLGMCFNHRRQSRDALVISDIIKRAEGQEIYMSPYSAMLFEGFDKIVAREDYLECAPEEGVCFIEREDVPKNITELVLYKWNRHYPQDKALGIDLSTGWEKISSEDFVGHSHEKITREEYKR